MASLKAQTLPAIRGNFVLLYADSLRLLVPQEDVGAAEYVDHSLLSTRDPGVFRHGEGEDERFVVALSDRMRVLPEIPANRFILTRVAARQRKLAFAWNEVHVLIDRQLEPLALPPAMRVEGAPIEQYVVHDGELVLCTTPRRIVSFVFGESHE
jgi:hypothetical protein